MKEQLVTFIENLKTDTSISSFDEAATKQIIGNLLSLLGWSTYKRDEVWLEYSVGSGRIDISLRINDSNKVFIEAKRVKEELERHQKQLLIYSSQEAVRLAILTNGVTWWFYLPSLQVRWEQKKFYTIDILQQEAEGIASKFIDFLAKENIASGKAIENAEIVYTSQQKQNILKETLPKAWNKIIAEPDELLVELINETIEKMCGYKADNEMIKQFLLNNKDRFCATDGRQPPVSSAPPQKRRPVEGTPSRTKAPTTYTGKKFTGFTFQDLPFSGIRFQYELLVKLSEILYTRHNREFLKKVLDWKGRTRVYFSYDREKLEHAKKVDKAGIYVETCWGAEDTVKRCHELIAMFGYSEKDLQIEYR